MNLAIAFRSEILKTKRTASWYFAITIAIAVSALFVLTVSANDPSQKVNPWTAIYQEEFKSLNLLVLPMFTILVCTLVAQIEYRNNTWKQVLASPQQLAQIYISKFLVVQLLLVLFLSVFLLSAGLCTLLGGMINPSMDLFDYSPGWQILAKCAVRTYVSILAVSAIQFVLGLIMRNFIAPIAIGFILWLIGNVLLFEMHSPIANFFPYSFSAMTVFSKYDASFPLLEFTSLGLTVLCLAGGFLFFGRPK
jgi:lantibiotic transport system permease protein